MLPGFPLHLLEKSDVKVVGYKQEANIGHIQIFIVYCSIVNKRHGDTPAFCYFIFYPPKAPDQGLGMYPEARAFSKLEASASFWIQGRGRRKRVEAWKSIESKQEKVV